MIVANDNLPESVTIIGSMDVVKSSEIEEYFSKKYGEPRGGYFIKVKGADGKRYAVAAKCQFTEEVTDDGEKFIDRDGWAVEWHDSERSAAKTLKEGWEYADKETECCDEETEYESFDEDAA
jgi:hypothetical protein